MGCACVWAEHLLELRQLLQYTVGTRKPVWEPESRTDILRYTGNRWLFVWAKAVWEQTNVPIIQTYQV